MPGRREAELTIALGRSFWNRGYATEAGAVIVELGFHSLGCARLVASIDASNDHARDLLGRLGFRFVPNRWPDPTSGSGVAGVIGILDAPR